MRCRKGIPSSLRAKAWQLLSNSKELLDANPGKFEVLLWLLVKGNHMDSVVKSPGQIKTQGVYAES